MDIVAAGYVRSHDYYACECAHMCDVYMFVYTKPADKECTQ